MKLQYTSDVHLDITKQVYIPKDPDANVLVVAGDLGKPFQANFLSFVAKASGAYEHVILVSGNHEYYSSKHTKTQIDEQLALVASKFSNVHYLLKGTLYLDGVLFLGTTLWSLIADTYKAQEVMNDYTQIKKKVGTIKKKISPADSVGWHLEELAWLEATLAANPSVPTVVVTHHAPSLKSAETSEIKDAYATNLELLILANPQIKWWIHGHVHHQLNYQIGSTLVVANPVGYPGELGPAKALVLDV